MKSFLSKFQELDFSSLLDINGGYGSSSSGSQSKKTGYSGFNSSRRAGSSGSGGGSYCASTSGLDAARYVNARNNKSNNAKNPDSDKKITSFPPQGYNALTSGLENFGSKKGTENPDNETNKKGGSLGLSQDDNLGTDLGTGDYTSPFGSDEKSLENQLVYSMEKDVSEKKIKYEEGVYQCDNYVQTKLEEAGVDTSKYLAGDAQEKNVSQHIASQSDLLTAPTESGVYVVYMKDGATPHCGLLSYDANGGANSVKFYDNSSNNGAKTPGIGKNSYSSIDKFNEDYSLYSTFYYKKVE